MRKIYLSLVFFCANLFAKAQFPAPYCAEAYSSGVEPITSVVIGTISNTSSAVTTGASAHENYTAQSTNVTQGNVYPITIKGNTDGAYTDYIRVFVDWNNDGDFLDTGESYDIGTIANSTGTDAIFVSGNIAVPATATVGSIRMRVTKKWSAYQTSCNTSGYGQSEDYSLNVIAAPSCSGTPNGGTASASNSLLCTSGTSTISVVGATAGLGISLQWQSSPTGANTFTDISGANSSSYSATITASTDFRCRVTCSNSNLTAFSSITTVTLSGIPANDDACNAQTLVLDATAVCGNTTCATATGDPSFTNSSPNNTVWYKFTPSTTGIYNFVMSRPTNVTSGYLYGWIGIYTATGSCPSLTFTEVSSSLSYDLTTQSSVTLVSPSLTAGTTYYFMVDGFSGAFGAYCMRLITPPTPPTCVTNISPANNATNVAAPNAVLTWNTVASATSYDVYFGTTNPPTTSIGNLTTATTTVTGLAYTTTYYWYISPKNSGGNATSCATNVTAFTTQAAPPPPANDSCGAAITLVGGVANNSNNFSATPSIAQDATCAAASGVTVADTWFKFTTVAAGTATIALTNASAGFDAIVVGYSGNCGALTTLTCADVNASGGSETLILNSLSANTTYYVRVYGYSATTGSFTLTLSGSAVPVTVSQFTAERKGNINQLNWSTATELNNSGFEVLRSADGINFSSLGFVASKAINGTSNNTLHYQFTDKASNASVYYRLKQVDKDGKTSLSNIVIIKGTKVNNLELVSVYPNPTTSTIRIAMAAPKNDQITLIIADVTGKIVAQQKNTLTQGDNVLSMNVEHLAKGTYTIKAVCATGCETAYSKFVKQ